MWIVVAILYLLYLKTQFDVVDGTLIDIIILAPILLQLLALVGRRNNAGQWEIDLSGFDRRDR